MCIKYFPSDAEGEGVRDRLPAGDDGTERAGHLPGLRGEGEDVGARAQEDEEPVRGQVEGQPAEGLQDGGRASQSNLSGRQLWL